MDGYASSSELAYELRFLLAFEVGVGFLGFFFFFGSAGVDLDVVNIPLPMWQLLIIGQISFQKSLEGASWQFGLEIDVAVLPRMVDDQTIGTFLEMLNLFFEVLVAFDIHFVELVFIYEIFGYIFQVFIGGSVEFLWICEEKAAFFEGESAELG